MSIVLIISDCLRYTFDELNPYICMIEYRCTACKKWMNEKDVVWIDSQNNGNPFHVKCAPKDCLIKLKYKKRRKNYEIAP